MSQNTSETWQKSIWNVRSLVYLIISNSVFWIKIPPQNIFEPRWEIFYNQNEITTNFIDPENVRCDLKIPKMTENIHKLSLQILQNYINSP